MPERAPEEIAWKRGEVGTVTCVRITARTIVGDEETRRVGDMLYALIEQEGRHRLVVDLGQVEFPSSAFLGKLLMLTMKVRQAGGRLALCNLGEYLERLLAPIPQAPAGSFGIFRDCDEALQWAGAGA